MIIKKKFIIVFILSITITMLLTSCVGIPFLHSTSSRDYKYMYDSEKLNNAEICIVKISDNQVVQTICKIESRKEFFDEFNELECHYYINDPVQKLSERGIKILYEDGSYEIITTSCNLYYDGNKRKYGRSYFLDDILENFIDYWIQI